MGYQVNYAGINLHDYMTVLNVKRTVLPPRTNNTINIPAVHGEKYTGFKYGAKEITLECLFNAETKEEHVENMKNLSYILDVKVPEKLIIEDMPDRYCYAVVEGTLDINKTFHNSVVNITFKCYDPFYYANERDYFEPELLGIVPVDNEGTAEAYPLVRCVFKNNANFFQVTNYEGKTVLLGAPSDCDSRITHYNPVVLAEPCENMDNWTNAGVNAIDGDRHIVSDATIGINGGGYALIPHNYGTLDTGWHGGAVRTNLSRAIGDFFCKFHISFNSTGATKQNGSGTALPNQKVNYKVIKDSGCALRKGRATSYDKLLTIPKGKSITCTEIVKNWGKATYGGKTGYVHIGNLTTTSNSVSSSSKSAETQRGRIEIYGFDKQGNKLFKCVMRDSSEFYEYNDPEIFLGEECVLHDGKKTPSPQTLTYKDAEGKKVTKKYNSGKYGDWNEFKGWFIVQRTSDKRGKQTWELKIQKVNDEGNVVKTLATKKISTGTYPTGELSNIVVWFGQWKDTEVVKTSMLRHVTVKDLAPTTATKKPYVFEAGDELEIDFQKQKVYLNGSLFMQELDIGSEFFSCPAGESEFRFLSDDSDVEVEASILKRWI